MTRPVDELKSSRSGQKAVIWKSEVRVDMEQPNMRLLFSAEEIERQVRRLANEISNDYQGCDLVLIGVLKGAFVFLADRILMSLFAAYLKYSTLLSAFASTVSSGEVRIIADIESDLQDSAVLIVEDIVDSGQTM